MSKKQAPKRSVKKAPKKAKAHRPGGGRRCIAPKCPRMSKGPRFHFLCDAHKKTPISRVRQWQKAC